MKVSRNSSGVSALVSSMPSSLTEIVNKRAAARYGVNYGTVRGSSGSARRRWRRGSDGAPQGVRGCRVADLGGQPPRVARRARRRVRRGGLEPPGGVPGLQPGAVAAAPPTHGVTYEIRTRLAGATTLRLPETANATVGTAGLEPAAPCTSGRCSPAELRDLWRDLRESNPHLPP